MKTKCDFVTNSSSCNFIMVGIKTTVEQVRNILKVTYGQEAYENGDYENNLPNGMTAMFEPEMIGKLIKSYSSDDYHLESLSLDLDTFKKHVKEVSKKLNVNESEVKLYIGSRNC